MRPFLHGLLLAVAVIVVEGAKYELLNQPLNQWVKEANAGARLRSLLRPAFCTASARDYLATWKIRGSALYLVALHDKPCSRDSAAGWVTGRLVIGQGEWTRPPG